jgi:hypothetical protein
MITSWRPSTHRHKSRLAIDSKCTLTIDDALDHNRPSVAVEDLLIRGYSRPDSGKFGSAWIVRILCRRQAAKL